MTAGLWLGGLCYATQDHFLYTILECESLLALSQPVRSGSRLEPYLFIYSSPSTPCVSDTDRTALSGTGMQGRQIQHPDTTFLSFLGSVVW
jgi:hypothetical protein